MGINSTCAVCFVCFSFLRCERAGILALFRETVQVGQFQPIGVIQQPMQQMQMQQIPQMQQAGTMKNPLIWACVMTETDVVFESPPQKKRPKQKDIQKHSVKLLQDGVFWRVHFESSHGKFGSSALHTQALDIEFLYSFHDSYMEKT